ncbi:MAG: NAD-dependent epimerase/dehydratase family protein [Propionicimonas sp.]
MHVLIIGGTGAISHAVGTEALARGARVTLVNRGMSSTHPVPDDAEVVIADARDSGAHRSALGSRSFDVVIDFVAFTAAHVADDIETFTGRTGQFVFISSASAYAKPVAMPVMVPGDGTSLWTLTHATDLARAFVQLLGREDVLGEAFHITRDDATPWDAIYRTIGRRAPAAPECGSAHCLRCTDPHPAATRRATCARLARRPLGVRRRTG